MKKNIIIASVFLIVISCIVVFSISYFRDNKNSDIQEVLSTTYRISNKYISLRAETDEILLNANKYNSYSSWSDKVSVIIEDWHRLENDAVALERDALSIADSKLSLNIINSAYAYDKQEISNIFDNAPAGKKIATLAKHLGVDAKRAYKILQQDQASLEADVWNNEGNTFRKLEVSATLIKDGCKVAGYIGGIVATGGAAGLATASTLSNAAVIVGGADLVLEVTEDGANIAIGDNNKISSISNSIRKVTEPISTLLTINEIPNNLKNGYEKFSSTMVVLDQFKGAAQDGKIIGIEIPVYNKNNKKEPVSVSILKKEEVVGWVGSRDKKQELNKDTSEKVVAKNNKIEEPRTENLYISSPEGKSFSPKNDLSFSANIRNPESILMGKKQVAVWCNWRFYLDDKLYVSKIVPSIIHENSKSVCGYSTLLIKEKGKLKIEFSLERGLKSKYSDEKNAEVFLRTVREYTVL